MRTRRSHDRRAVQLRPPDQSRRTATPGVAGLRRERDLVGHGTLSGRFEAVGAPEHLARLWFAELLRDGFALTVSSDIQSFAALGAEALRVRLRGQPLNRPVEEAVDHVMQGFSELAVHPDVVEGIGALSDLGVRLVTLSNGSAGVADTLLQGAGVRDRFERLLTVEDAGVWKPTLRA